MIQDHVRPWNSPHRRAGRRCALAPAPAAGTIRASWKAAARRMGREGGIATFLKYGREPMAVLGRKGYLVTCARWFDGDEAEMNRWLHKQASERQLERMVSAKLDARIAGSEARACEELPIILDPEDDPFFDETPRRWAERVLTPKPAAARKR